MALDRERANYHTRQLSPLLSLVLDLADSEATDPLDMVYALLGIAHGQEDAKKRMLVEYKSSFEQMIINMARSHVLNYDPLHTRLSSTRGYNGLAEHLESASWLKDYPPQDAPLAPFQRSWYLYGPISPQLDGDDCGKYVHGFTITKCWTSIAAIHILYASGTTLLLALVEAPYDTFRLVDALRISEEHADTLNVYMMRLSNDQHPRNPHSYGHDKGKQWESVLVPCFYAAAQAGLAQIDPGERYLWQLLIHKEDFEIPVPHGGYHLSDGERASMLKKGQEWLRRAS